MDQMKIVLNGGQDYIIVRAGSGNSIEIVDIAVRTHREQGIGRLLVQEALRRIPQGTIAIWAFVRETNEVAHKFYAAIGFVRCGGELTDFYGLGQHAGLWRKDLSTLPYEGFR